MVMIIICGKNKYAVERRYVILLLNNCLEGNSSYIGMQWRGVVVAFREFHCSGFFFALFK